MNVLISIVSGISFADTMVRMHPRVEGEIAKAVQQTCGHPLPIAEVDREEFHDRSMTLTAQITDICFRDTMAGLSGYPR